MSEARFRTFEEFWPFYVREHSRPATRRLHFLGTTVSVTALATGLLTGRKWLAAIAPVFGYGPAWISHFFVERTVGVACNCSSTTRHKWWLSRARTSRIRSTSPPTRPMCSTSGMLMRRARNSCHEPCSTDSVT